MKRLLSLLVAALIAAGVSAGSGASQSSQSNGARPIGPSSYTTTHTAVFGPAGGWY